MKDNDHSKTCHLCKSAHNTIKMSSKITEKMNMAENSFNLLQYMHFLTEIS